MYTPAEIRTTPPSADEAQAVLASIYHRAVAERGRIVETVMSERFDYTFAPARELASHLNAVEKTIITALVAIGVGSRGAEQTPPPG
jgi:hypothetical protein